MSLEAAIKQHQFKNDTLKAILNVMVSNSWIVSHTNRWLRPYNLSPQQYNVLRILRGAHPQSYRMADIADRMIDSNSNATRIIDKLILKDLVKKTTDCARKNQVCISITEQGLSLLAVIDETEADFLANFDTLTVLETKRLNQLLEKFRDT